MVSCCGVTERQVCDVFTGADECVLASFDEGVARVSRIVADAARCETESLARIRAVLRALLRFFDGEPVWARFLILEGPGESGAVVERRHRALTALAHALRRETQARSVDPGSSSPSRQLIAELVVGGVFSVLRGRLLEGPKEPLIELEPSLVPLVIGPYQARNGPGAARQAAAPGDHQEPRAEPSPVRTTYRTTRVLSAIAAAPNLSNREIGDAAGVNDQGQTSKLLRRLERRGLVENVGLGQAYGEANAWLLTAYGERVLEATRHSLVPGAGAVVRRRVRGAA